MKSKKVKCWIVRDDDSSLWAYLSFPRRVLDFYVGKLYCQLPSDFCDDLKIGDEPRCVLLDISISYIEDYLWKN